MSEHQGVADVADIAALAHQIEIPGAVRGIAERNLDGQLAIRAVRREALTAILNGLIIASLAAVVVYLWFQNSSLALVIFAAMGVIIT